MRNHSYVKQKLLRGEVLRIYTKSLYITAMSSLSKVGTETFIDTKDTFS